MDKTTLSKYGWIIITVVIVVVMVVGAPTVRDRLNDEMMTVIEQDVGAHKIVLVAPDAQIEVDHILVIKNKPYGHLPTPIRDGKVFAGWYTDPMLGEHITSQTIYQGIEGRTLYAHWQ